MLSNYDIEDVSHVLKLPIRAAVSKDELEDETPRVGSYYVLLASHPDAKHPSHWVFLRLLPNHDAIYFDPSGSRTHRKKS